MTPNFAAWDTQTLAKFALDAHLRMQEQQERIEQLTADIKTAMEAYRMLIKGTSYDSPGKNKS